MSIMSDNSDSDIEEKINIEQKEAIPQKEGELDIIHPIKPLNINKFDYSIDGDDLFLVGDSLINLKGLVSHHLESANNFYKNGIKQIITNGFVIAKDLLNRRSLTDEDKSIDRIHCIVIPTDVQLKPPGTMHYNTSKELVLYPKVAFTREKYYSGHLLISCTIKATAYLKDGTTIERSDKIQSFRICKVPIIKGSIMCNTYGKSKEALMHLGEDPSDPGAYFIVKGEWAVDSTENITYNQPKIYLNEGYGKSRGRCEYISKPGDTYQNSDYILLRYFNDETFTIEISRDKLANIQLPFFMVFRALGWSSDKMMMDWIIFDYDDEANKTLLSSVVLALNAKYNKTNYKDIYNQQDVLRQIVNMIPEELFRSLDLQNKPENYHNAMCEVLKIFDTYCLPHIGMTAASRDEKLKFLALLIRKTILVYLNYIPPTDRDSYRNKRIHSAGDNYAKAFKTFFNQTIVLPIKRRMIKDFNSSSFSQVNLVNLVKTAIYSDEFERVIVQTINSGNKSSLKIKKKNIINRLSTQILNRKNQLNVLATMRQITATSADSAKQSERASEMRRVHMSALGYICISHSPPEGEKVGINKQMAIFATISTASSSEVLKKKLRDDSSIVAEHLLEPLEIYRGNYGRVYVNGYLMGYTKNTIALTSKYRKLRRMSQINIQTTIYWDNTQNEVQFFVDVGRITRPLIIVYNNIRDQDIVTGLKDSTNKESKTNDNKESKISKDKNGNNFTQGIGITNEDLKMLYQNKKTIDDLIKEQKVEYITPEEQENCYICPNFEQMVKDRNNELHEYTHLDIPQSQLGITALTAPFGNHNQAPRVTFQTSQSKQTCGHYALNWPFRVDKETYLQYINEMPLIRTAVNKYVFPNGVNVMVAMMCYTGSNQEDSLIINKASVERGLFDLSKFTFYKTEFEQKEVMCNPDVSTTDGIKTANYDKLVNGIVPEGTYIHADDVLIGKSISIPKGKNDKFSHVDKSIVYKEDERAIVHKVIDDRNEEDQRFVKVSLRKIRPVVVGDKFCLGELHDVLTSAGWKNIKKITLNDKIATLNPNTNLLEWNYPSNVYSFEHKGEMYEIENKLIHLITTLNHKMYVKTKSNGTYSLIEANNLINKKVWYKRDCENKNPDIVEFELPEITLLWKGKPFTYPSRRFDMNNWLTFIGIYLSEGHIDQARNLRISAHKPRVASKLEEILTNMGIEYIIYTGEENYRYIKSHQISNYFNQFGKANDKFIPEWCKCMSHNNSKALLDGLLLGDGYYCSNNKSWEYYSNSKQLVEDVQLLAIMTGSSATINIKNLKGEEVIIKNIKTERSENQYRVYITNYKPCMHPASDYRDFKETINNNFDGNVYCIEVPNHIFMTRLNDKYCWTGNSSRSG